MNIDDKHLGLIINMEEAPILFEIPLSVTVELNGMKKCKNLNFWKRKK